MLALRAHLKSRVFVCGSSTCATTNKLAFHDMFYVHFHITNERTAEAEEKPTFVPQVAQRYQHLVRIFSEVMP